MTASARQREKACPLSACSAEVQQAAHDQSGGDLSRLSVGEQLLAYNPLNNQTQGYAGPPNWRPA